MRKVSSILKGKGLYIAVCAAALAVGGAGFFAYNSMSDGENSQLPLINQGDVASITEAQVDANQSGVPITTDVVVTTISPKESDVSAGIAIENEAKEAIVNQTITSQPMVRPINGEIICEYSNGELVKSSTLNVWKTHDGVDIQANVGDSVKSMSTGTITAVNEDAMWGVCVVIDHGNGIEGHYYGLEKTVPVSIGDTVSAGSIIGTVGNTAEAEIADPAHLHFAIKNNGSWVDPATMVSSIGS